jgi:hypothetical protein
VKQEEFLALGGVGSVSAVFAGYSIPSRFRSTMLGCSSLPSALALLGDSVFVRQLFSTLFPCNAVCEILFVKSTSFDFVILCCYMTRLANHTAGDERIFDPILPDIPLPDL